MRRGEAGDAGPVEAVTAALRALEGRPELNAVITLTAERALAAARRGSAGPLAGVPVLVKDLFDTAGVRTTYGSRIFAAHVPRRTAPAVSALEAAGAIVVGKANCDEFAWGVSGHNPHWGDVANPRHPGRISGGSSAGNAAALAAGLVPLALGTDTGGSVRMPAAACEVVGFKPRLGTISTVGAFPLVPSFDTVGPMARTVAECARAWAVLTGRRVPAPRLAGLRVGVLTRPPLLAPGPRAAEPDERGPRLAERLAALGARVTEVELPIPAGDTWAVFYGEAAASHRELFPARRAEYGRVVATKLDDAQRVTPAALAAGRAVVAEWRRRAAREPAIDLVVSPTLAAAELPSAGVDELEVRVAMSAYTRPFSFLGWAAIAIGELQLAARDEETLLAAALALERER